MRHVGAAAVRSAGAAILVAVLVVGGNGPARPLLTNDSWRNTTAEAPPIPTTLEELVRFAGSNDGPVDLIVVARVATVDREGLEPLRIPQNLRGDVPRPTFPYTDLLLDIDDVLAGTPTASRVRLREPGHASSADAAASIPTVGTRLILLLNEHPSGEYYNAHPYAKIDLSSRPCIQ